MIPVQIEMRSIVARSRRRERLRALLSDGRWHTTAELLAAAGSGVSSRLHELREGADGLPSLVIEAERIPGGEGWRYRVTDERIPGANLDGGRAEAVIGYRCEAGDRDRPCATSAGAPLPGPSCALAGCPFAEVLS